MRTLIYVIIVFTLSCFVDISGCKTAVESTIRDFNITTVQASPTFEFSPPDGSDPCTTGTGFCRGNGF